MPTGELRFRSDGGYARTTRAAPERTMIPTELSDANGAQQRGDFGVGISSALNSGPDLEGSAWMLRALPRLPFSAVLTSANAASAARLMPPYFIPKYNDNTWEGLSTVAIVCAFDELLVRANKLRSALDVCVALEAG